MSTTLPFGHDIIITEYCQNSMDWGKELLATHPHGLLLHAEKHGTTRGRQGRSWTAMPQQLLLTFLVKPSAVEQITTVDDHKCTGLVYLYYALNIALCSSINEFIPTTCHIKWPNDCIIEQKKVAGMLLEPVWQANQFVGLVLGIGLNVNNRFAKESELVNIATSMRMHLFREALDVEEVRQSINQHLTSWYATWQSGKYEQIWQRWQEQHLQPGSQITVHRADGTPLSGTIKTLTRDGSIIIRADDSEHTLTIADI